MPQIGATITPAAVRHMQDVLNAQRELLTSDAKALLVRVVLANEDVFDAFEDRIKDAILFAIEEGTDEGRKASIEYILDRAVDKYIPTEAVFDRSHVVWSDLHHSDKGFIEAM